MRCFRRRLVPAFVASRAADDGAPPLLEQLVLADFLRDEHLARHLRRMRLVYRERRNALLDALAERCATRLTPGPAGAGIHLAATLHRGSDRAIAKRAAERGLTAFALSEFALEPGSPGGLVLGFAGWSPARIRNAVDLLGACCGDAT